MLNIHKPYLSHVPKLSTEKRIILHISKYSNFEEAWEAPIDISQEGISQKMDILQNNVSRAIASLKNEQIVYEKLSYIKKGKRRRKTYFLTDKGKELTKNIENELSSNLITIKTKNNEIVEEKASRLIHYLEKEYNTKVNLQEIIEYSMKNDIFDIEDFLKKEQKEEKIKTVKMINYTKKAPQLFHFFGRKNELIQIKECINSKEYRIIVIQGIAGIGKTTLSLKLIEEYKDTRNLFWYRFHDWDSVRNITRSLSEFLASQGKKKLSNYLRKKLLDINEIGGILEIELNNCILFFDDFHRAEKEILNLFSLFIEIVERNKNIKIIILTRESGAFYDIRDIEKKKIIKEIKLGALDKKISRKLLKEGINEESFENIYSLAKGVPLFLELLSSANVICVNNINTFIDKEIFSKLTQNERNLLNLISVFRYPVPSNALLIQEGILYEDISSLVNRLIILALPFNNFEVHDIIRDFVYFRLSLEQKKKYNKIAASYYLKNSEEEINPIVALEAIYHLQMCENWEDALDFAIRVVPYLISEGYFEVNEILEKFIEENISKEKLSNLLVLKGDLAYAQENWHDASENYKNALQIKQGHKSDKKIIAEIHGKLGKTQMNINQWEETISSHEKALKIFENMGNKKGIARKYLDLGLVYRNRKNLKRALEYYNRSLEIFQLINDKKGQAAVYNNLGLLFQSKGKFGEARKNFEISSSISENEKDFVSRAITIYNLGEMDLKRRKWKEAIANFSKSAKIFKKVKKKKNEIFCNVKIGEVYFERGNIKDALEYYLISLKKLENIHHERRKIFSKKHDKIEYREIINLWNKIADAYERNGDVRHALEYHKKVLDAIEKEVNKIAIARKYLEICLVYEKLNDYGNSILNMKKSLKILVEIKETKGIIALNLNLGRVFKKKGDMANAKIYFENALEQAKKVKDRDGVKNAREGLEKIKF